MQQNKSSAAPASSEKRNLGFVKLRRGLREHLHRSRMSSNASTLFVWLLLSARHSGPTRGCVEANIDDLMLFLGWTRSMVKRTLAELVQKGYILFGGAVNQHELGTIKITKFDLEETDSARLTGEPSTKSENSGELTARLSAGFTGEPSSEPSRPSKLQSPQDLQAPKNAVEVKKEKNEKLDAVRRPFDAEHHLASRKSFSPSERRKKLEKCLTDKIQKNNNANDDELFSDECEAFAYIKYGVRDPRGLARGFVCVVGDVYYDHKKELPPPGILCSKIIDRCMSEQKSCRTLGSDPSEYFWPPDFQEHRDRLRERERLAEKVRP